MFSFTLSVLYQQLFMTRSILTQDFSWEKLSAEEQLFKKTFAFLFIS